MSTMRAIRVEKAGKPVVDDNVAIPQPYQGYLQVRIKAVALNPTDWKHAYVESWTHLSSRLGCDYVGTITTIGPSSSPRFAKGDRVAGFIHGGKSTDKTSGAFATFALAKAATQLKIPDGMSDEAAACLGIGFITVGQGLYQSLGLPLPDEVDASKPAQSVLIYGGSTATGLIAIQFAVASGLKVVTTCSKRNAALVKSLGAEEAFDYSDPECAAKIRDYTHNGLMHAFDCISEDSSPEICAGALSSKEAVKYSALLPDGPKLFGATRKDAALNTMTVGYTAMGEAFEFAGQQVPAVPEDLAFIADKMVPITEGLLKEGKLKTFPILRKGGLDGVLAGLEELKAGKVSGGKLVYKFDE